MIKSTPKTPYYEMEILLFSIAIVIFLARKVYQWRKFKLPPGPHPWPILGNLHKLKSGMFKCFSEWSNVYGPIISMWAGSNLIIIVSSPELAKAVLKDYDHHLADRHRLRSTAKITKDGKDLIWADYGARYVKLRKICTLELFSAKSLEALRPIREEEVNSMVESILAAALKLKQESHGQGLQLRHYLGLLALNHITRLVLGRRFVTNKGTMDEQGLEFKAIVADGIKLGASVGLGEHIWWLRWISRIKNHVFSKFIARRERLTRAIMEEHVPNQSKGNNASKHCFVHALLSLQKSHNIDEDTVIGLLWDMIAAGMDTLAIAIEWAMAELIRNPKVQQKAQEELDHVIGSDRVVSESDFRNLPYLNCVTKEALRLHPPTPLLLPHKANKALKIGGYDVPEGTTVMVNAWAIARDPVAWKEPLEFLPERFLEEDVDMKGTDFRLLPFGAGRRMCPGAQLSTNLVMLMLGNLLHRFRWSPAGGLRPEEIDISESPGLVQYMRTPLQAVPTPRLLPDLHKVHKC